MQAEKEEAARLKAE